MWILRVYKWIGCTAEERGKKRRDDKERGKKREGGDGRQGVKGGEDERERGG